MVFKTIIKTFLKVIYILSVVICFACCDVIDNPSNPDEPVIIDPSGPGPVNDSDDEFTLVLFPDTQGYTDKGDDEGETVYKTQVDWVKEHKEDYNIKAVLHLGDVTEENDSREWVRAWNIHEELDLANIPYTITTGNHDYERVERSLKRNTSRIDEEFLNKPSWNEKFNQDEYGYFDLNGMPYKENNYYKFEACGQKFLVLNLEFAPRTEVIIWANKIVSENKDRAVFVVTHGNLHTDGSYHTTWDKTDNHKNVVLGNAGDTLAEQLTMRHSNIVAVISGHTNGDIINDKTVDFKGKELHTFEILADYQKVINNHDYDGDDGGNGFVRLLKINTKENIMQITTISTIGEEDYGSIEYKFYYGIHNGNDFVNSDGRKKYFQTSDLNLNERIADNYVYNNINNINVINYESAAISKSNYSIFINSYIHDMLVNQSTSGSQVSPYLSQNSNGDYVVAWQHTTSVLCVKKYANNGKQLLPNEIQISGTNPRAEIDDNGDFVILYQNGRNTYVKGYYSDGTVKFGARSVKSDTKGNQYHGCIDMNGNGDFVVIWSDDPGKDGMYNIRGSYFYSNGSKKFETRINADKDGQQIYPAVAIDESGNFCAVWMDDPGKDKIYNLRASYYYSSGSKKFEIRINSDKDGQQGRPDIAMDENGNFCVVWEDDPGKDGKYNIRGRYFYSNGSAVFEKLINSDKDGQQTYPTIDMNNNYFVVAWQDDKDKNGYYNILHKVFSVNGSVLVNETKSNFISQGNQKVPSVVIDKNENKIGIVWKDDYNRNDKYDIVLRGINF